MNSKKRMGKKRAQRRGNHKAFERAALRGSREKAGKKRDERDRVFNGIGEGPFTEACLKGAKISKKLVGEEALTVVLIRKGSARRALAAGGLAQGRHLGSPKDRTLEAWARRVLHKERAEKQGPRVFRK